MPKLFLKRSQATSSGGTTSSTSNSGFGFRRRNETKKPLHAQQKVVQGSEAVAVESQRVNAKTFKYPPTGFENWIENTLLYTMIRESSIFPPETVLQAIEEEDFSQYFYVKEEEKEEYRHRTVYDEDDDNDNDETDPSTTKAAEVSYAQLTALLALAGEEWRSSSDVPQRLCKVISKEIIKYANKHDLDREHELKELLDPLIEYAKGRGRKQALQMLPWFAALTVSTINPLAFYATYMSMLAANSDALNKGDRADRNTMDMTEMGKKHGNVEQASLLDEDYYNDDDE